MFSSYSVVSDLLGEDDSITTEWLWFRWFTLLLCGSFSSSSSSASSSSVVFELSSIMLVVELVVDRFSDDSSCA